MLCWCCEKAQMEDAPKVGRGWKRCPECGATWIKPIKLAPLLATIERDSSTGRTKWKSRPVSKKWRPKK